MPNVSLQVAITCAVVLTAVSPARLRLTVRALCCKAASTSPIVIFMHKDIIKHSIRCVLMLGISTRSTLTTQFNCCQHQPSGKKTLCFVIRPCTNPHAGMPAKPAHTVCNTCTQHSETPGLYTLDCTPSSSSSSHVFPARFIAHIAAN
jgi:hypothetical protein